MGFKPFNPTGGGGGNPLTPDQEAAVDSIVNAPDDALLLSVNGQVAPSLFRQTSDIKIEGEAEVQLLNRSAVSFGEQFAVSEAGGTLMTRDRTTGRRTIPCSSPVNFSAVSPEAVTGKPFSFRWSDIQFFPAQPDTDATNQGNYQFLAPITFDRVITSLNFKVQTPVNGVRVIIQENNSSGPVIFKSHTDLEWERGEGIVFDLSGNGTIDLLDPEQGTPILVETSIPLFVTIEKFSNPQDLVIVGTVLNPAAPGLFLPFLTQNYFIETRSELVNSLIYTPVYKNATSADLSVNNLETIAADTDSFGALTLNVNVDDVDVFWVFDYAGRWNSFSRRVTVSLSNGDNYFLTRRNRKYFFYKDDQGNWQWYYEPHFLG
jgi:hypothetical protein